MVHYLCIFQTLTHLKYSVKKNSFIFCAHLLFFATNNLNAQSTQGDWEEMMGTPMEIKYYETPKAVQNSITKILIVPSTATQQNSAASRPD